MSLLCVRRPFYEGFLISATGFFVSPSRVVGSFFCELIPDYSPVRSAAELAVAVSDELNLPQILSIMLAYLSSLLRQGPRPGRALCRSAAFNLELIGKFFEAVGSESSRLV